MTNFEHITQSPEILAKQIDKYTICDRCPAREPEVPCEDSDCSNIILRWLLTESEV